jgi:hypothetical protein
MRKWKKSKQQTTKQLAFLMPQQRQIEWSVLQMGFVFESAFMQEHYNETYMESAKFPKATFKGTGRKHELLLIFKSDGTYKVQSDG